MAARRFALAAFLPVAAVLPCAACVSGGDDAVPTDTVTTAVTTVTDSAPPGTSVTQDTLEQLRRETSPSSPPAEPAPPPAAGGGIPGEYNGMPVTFCAAGDGWGISELAVNSNTSCEFGLNVLGALGADVPTTDNIRNHLPQTVSAYSPVTGRTYDMRCEDNGVGIVTCRGGADAEVIMH